MNPAPLSYRKKFQTIRANFVVNIEIKNETHQVLLATGDILILDKNDFVWWFNDRTKKWYQTLNSQRNVMLGCKYDYLKEVSIVND